MEDADSFRENAAAAEGEQENGNGGGRIDGDCEACAEASCLNATTCSATTAWNHISESYSSISGSAEWWELENFRWIHKM